MPASCGVIRVRSPTDIAFAITRARELFQLTSCNARAALATLDFISLRLLEACAFATRRISLLYA